MPTILPAAAFMLGLVLAVLREGALRLAGTTLMLAAGGWALASIDGGAAAAWAAGPIVASLVLTSKRLPRLAFEALMLRSAVTMALLTAGGFFALRLALGDIPWPVFAMSWVTAALGLSWLSQPRDRVEARRGAVLAIAGGGALLLEVFPSGLITAGLCGVLALAPVLAEWTNAAVERRMRPVRLSLTLGGIAAVCAVAALVSIGSRAGVADLSLMPDGLALTGVALLLASAAFAADLTLAAAASLAALSLLLVAPAAHWAAMAAALTTLTWEPKTARPLWAGLTLLALSPVLSLLIFGPLGARWEAAALAVGWLALLAARAEGWVVALVLASSTFFLAEGVRRLSPASLNRFQLVAAAGVVLLILVAISTAQEGWRAGRWRSIGTVSLIIVAVATALPLGTLAAVLLTLDLAVVQASSPTGAPALGEAAGIGMLARSGWPPSAAFAGRVLTLLSAASAATLLAVVAALLVAALQLVPLLDRRPPARPSRRATFSDWVATVISLGVGCAPVVVQRMLHG
jgi:hypothetical protein